MVVHGADCSSTVISDNLSQILYYLRSTFGHSKTLTCVWFFPCICGFMFRIVVMLEKMLKLQISCKPQEVFLQILSRFCCIHLTHLPSQVPRCREASARCCLHQECCFYLCAEKAFSMTDCPKNLLIRLVHFFSFVLAS